MSFCAGAGCLRSEEWLNRDENYMEHFRCRNLCVVVVKCFFRVCGVRQNFYLFSLYCNLDLDDWILTVY